MLTQYRYPTRVALLVALALLSACQMAATPAPPTAPATAETPTSQPPASPTPRSQPTPRPTRRPTLTPVPTAAAPDEAVLYLGIMIHLEGWADVTDRDVFERHADLIRGYGDLFERYGAKLTLESKEFTGGCLTWGDNVLQEMEARGHGIGLHADVGGSRTYACRDFTQDLLTMKQQLEQLGVTVRHASGITSHCDWVDAATGAGFLFTTGTVAYSTLSLRPDLQPPEYQDCTTPSKCHQPYPIDLEGRLHPWRARSSADWILPAPDGDLVILPESGGLICQAETGGDASVAPAKCEFAPDDIDVSIRELEAALALVDPRRVNTYYLAWSLGGPLNEALLEQWLQRIQPYVDAGQVVWATLPEMYDTFVQWEQTGGAP